VLISKVVVETHSSIIELVSWIKKRKSKPHLLGIDIVGNTLIRNTLA